MSKETAITEIRGCHLNLYICTDFLNLRGIGKLLNGKIDTNISYKYYKN